MWITFHKFAEFDWTTHTRARGYAVYHGQWSEATNRPHGQGYAYFFSDDARYSENFSSDSEYLKAATEVRDPRKKMRERETLMQFMKSIAVEERRYRLDEQRDQDRLLELGEKRRGEEYLPDLKICNGLQYRHVDGDFVNGYLTGDVTIWYGDGSEYRGPFVYECPSDAADDDVTSSDDDTSRLPSRYRGEHHWGVFRTPDGTKYSGAIVDNHFNARCAEGTLEVRFATGDVCRGMFFDGMGRSDCPARRVTLCWHAVVVCVQDASKAVHPWCMLTAARTSGSGSAVCAMAPGG